MRKLFKILTILSVIKLFLDIFGYYVIWPFPQELAHHIWFGAVAWTIMYLCLALGFSKRYRITPVFMILLYGFYLWQYRNLGFSPLLFFHMGLLAQIDMVVILLSVALSIITIIKMIRKPC